MRRRKTQTTQDTPDQEAENQDGRKHRGHRGLRHGLATAAETIGIDVEDLVTEVQAGSSVADVAAANGSSGQAVIDAIVANVSDRIDAAVADGRFTAEEGADKLSQVTGWITDMVNGDLELPERGDRGRRGHRGLRHGLGTAAETIGIDVEDLVTEVQAGSSVADVAAANGSSGQAVIDAIVANASERIDTAVENGRFTAEEGAAKLSEVTTRITDFVNGDLELRERGDRGRRGPQGTDATDA